MLMYITVRQQEHVVPTAPRTIWKSRDRKTLGSKQYPGEYKKIPCGPENLTHEKLLTDNQSDPASGQNKLICQLRKAFLTYQQV